MATTLEALKNIVIQGNPDEARALTEKALADGIAAETIIGQALIPAMSIVGERFECGEYYLPEMMVAARAMQEGMNLLRPLLTQTDFKPAATAALGTVKGDLHDIGKNLVGMMLEGAGFEVIDLGVDVPPEKFIEAIQTHDVALVGMSALLTTTTPMMRTTIEALREAGVRDRVGVMIGGAAITQAYADEIGADAYAPDASTAARKAKSLLGLG